MNKLKYKKEITKVLMYSLIILVASYLIYIFINVLKKTTTKEGLVNPTTSANALTKQLLCRSDQCMKGCKEPSEITEQCGSSIYRDIENKCYKLCTYTCESIDAPCIANDCCVGCKQKKFEVPCGDLIPKGADPGISTDGTFAPFFATGYADIEDDPRATEKAVQIYKMMKDVSTVYNKYNGELLNTNEYECRPNITGTFTECGPAPSMRMKYE